jgi:hypothetical protein
MRKDSQSVASQMSTRMAEKNYTLSGENIVPTLEDLAKVSSKEEFGMQDLVIQPSYYLAFGKMDFSSLFADSTNIEVSNTGRTGAFLYYRLECADCNDGWDVVGEKSEVFCLAPREKHVLTLSAILDTKTVISIKT